MSDFKPEVVTELDELIKRKGKPTKQAEANQPKHEITQTAKDGGVIIQNHGTVNYNGPAYEERTRADNRTRQAKAERKAKAKDVVGDYTKQRYESSHKPTKREFARRAADKLEAENKARNDQMWIIITMLVAGCLLALTGAVLFGYAQ